MNFLLFCFWFHTSNVVKARGKFERVKELENMPVYNPYVLC